MCKVNLLADISSVDMMNSSQLNTPAMSTINHYLKALGSMSECRIPQMRAWARKILMDLCEPGVSIHDYLRPYMTLPFDKLTDPFERVLRLKAEVRVE